jgi:hypothetical protein
VKSRKVRFTTALVTFGLFVALAGLMVPTAFAAGKLQLRFVASRGPANAVKDATITSAPFDAAGASVQVELVDSSNPPKRVTNQKVTVTLGFASGSQVGALTVSPRTTVNGVATFDALSIGTLNEPQFTDYRLIPATTKGSTIPGVASAGFDIWETACLGANCSVGLRADGDELAGFRDVYTSSGASLAATQMAGAFPGLQCDGYRPVFANEVFIHESSGTGPVKLEMHVTREDMKASPQNGQAHVGICLGLTKPWAADGGTAVQKDTDLVGGPDLYVGLAPACPNMSPELSAPCIVSQTGDGEGGSFTVAWVPGGDPPRRT